MTHLKITRWNQGIEKYYKSIYGKACYRPKMYTDICGKYVLTSDYAALEAQLAAARKEALEEAWEALLTKVVKRGPEDYRVGKSGYNNGVDACEDVIRALIETPTKKETQ